MEKKSGSIMFKISCRVILIIFISCNSNPLEHDNQSYQLMNKTWELVSINYFGGSELVDKGEFTILFSDSGTLSSKMDCNECFGDYSTTENNMITIHSEGCTEVYCGANSRDSEVHNALKNATTYFVDDEALRIYFGKYYLFFKSK